MCRIHTNIKFGERWNTLKGFIRPALGRRNLDMVTDAHVSKVSISDWQVPDTKQATQLLSQCAICVLYKVLLVIDHIKSLCYLWCKTMGNLSSEFSMQFWKKRLDFLLFFLFVFRPCYFYFISKTSFKLVSLSFWSLNYKILSTCINLFPKH